MDDSGNARDDLTLPKGTEESEKLAKQIMEEFEGGKEIYVTVLKVGLSILNLHRPISLRRS